MYRNATVGVVVPAYNEAGFVGDVLTGLPAFVDRIYAIDDCSSDGTWDEIVETAAILTRRAEHQEVSDQFHLNCMTAADGVSEESDSSPESVALLNDRVDSFEWHGNIVAIEHTENFGAGGAIKTGYLAALIDGVDIIVTIDADGQMDPTIMDRLVKPVVDGTAEYAKGTRFVGDESRSEMPAIRTFGNTVLTYLTKVTSGYWGMTDSQNGYTAISRSALQNLGVEDLFEYYAYCNAVLIRLNVNNTPIADVSVPTAYGDETSDIKYSVFILKVAPMLLQKFGWRLQEKYLRSGRPTVALLYIFGCFCFLLWTTIITSSRILPLRVQNRKITLGVGLSAICSIAAAVGYEWSVAYDLVTVVENGQVEDHLREQETPVPADQ